MGVGVGGLRKERCCGEGEGEGEEKVVGVAVVKMVVVDVLVAWVDCKGVGSAVRWPWMCHF